MAEGSFAAGLVGIVLDGRYRLDALLGEGGMGAVFRAHHLAMDRKVAVKLLKPHLTSDETALQRFAREARATMRVDSEHAVKVLDFGITPHRDYYMVLEYLDGRTVQRELDVDGPFAPARVVHIAKQALDALGAAHQSGLVHRDVKPDNLLLMRVGDDPDYVKVLDFGVAKLMDGAARSARSALALTQAGMVFGTPEFMSPEQACGQQLDGRSDLYSLAATMFAMLTGCGMYPAKTAIEWLTSHARVPPPHLADAAPALARYEELDAFLQKCLAKSRDDRPQSAAEMKRLLERLESTLVAGERAALPALRGSTFSPSSYVEAIDPNATLVPGAGGGARGPGVASEAALAKTMRSTEAPSLASSMPSTRAASVAPHTAPLPPTTIGVIAQVQGSSRGAWLVLGALAIAASIGAAIVLATNEREPSRMPRVAEQSAHDAATIPPDAQVLANAAPADAATVPADAASRDAADVVEQAKPQLGGHDRATEPRRSEVARLIGEAEQAKRTRNLLRWVLKADAALQLDPRNVRARLLLGEGLIASGDLDRGCKYLRELGRNPAARARARAAGCPTD